MSRLGCRCGHIIRDQTNSLPYKGSVLPDVRHDLFFNWVSHETQSYVAAALGGSADQWLLDKGYTPDYVALKLNHGEVLHDHIHTHYLDLKRDIYECEACGRIHMETMSDNNFVSYMPDSGKFNAVLAEGSNET
jgi:hypothetical protein